jgi:transposase
VAAVIRPPASLPQVYLCREPVDMRKSIDGLAALVEGVLALDPFSAQLFVFTNRRRDKVKCLYWERNGFCLWYKRLERERFHWPVHFPGAPIVLTGQQLNWLLDGYDLRHWRAHQPLAYKSVL